jgi:hypothetical protein
MHRKKAHKKPLGKYLYLGAPCTKPYSNNYSKRATLSEYNIPR